MADEQFDRLASFREFIQRAEAGAAIPTVDESDLKMLHQVCVDMTKRYSGKDGVVSLDVMARACSRDANLPAVWLRHEELRLMARHGLLAAWQHGTALDDAVFHAAATVPMRGVCFDREEFVKRLGARRCRKSQVSAKERREPGAPGCMHAIALRTPW